MKRTMKFFAGLFFFTILIGQSYLLYTLNHKLDRLAGQDRLSSNSVELFPENVDRSFSNHGCSPNRESLSM